MENKSLSTRRRLYDRGLRVLLYLCGFITCALLVLIIGYIFYRGIPNVTWQLLSTQTSYLNDTLTGIPSIIFGLVGMLFFIQLMGLKTGVLAGSLTLVVMILPTIVRTTQESLKTVPQSYREGALALGAGKWHMVRTVVLPNSVDGIVTGCILAVGRIVGESAALLYTAGFGVVLNDFVTSLQAASGSLTVALYMYSERGETGVGFAIATILMLLTLLINLAATLVGRRLKK